jgi:hypothetical protein
LTGPDIFWVAPQQIVAGIPGLSVALLAGREGQETVSPRRQRPNLRHFQVLTK